MCYFVRLLARALLDWVSFQHGQTCFAVIQMMLDVLLSVMRRDANILSPKTNNGHVSSKTLIFRTFQSKERTTKIGGLFTAPKHCPENI